LVGRRQDFPLRVCQPAGDRLGLEPGPSLEDEGDEILVGNPTQSGRVDRGDLADGPAAGLSSCTPGQFRSYCTFSELCIAPSMVNLRCLEAPLP